MRGEHEEATDLDGGDKAGGADPSVGDGSDIKEMIAANVAAGIMWIARGLPVFPIAISWNETKGKTDKRPLTGTGGYKKATTDRDIFNQLVYDGATQIKAGEVLACATVPGPGGFVVFDGDVDNGKRGVEFLHDELKLPPYTYTPLTGSGGVHRWYRKRDVAASISNTSPWTKNGVDIRSDNGYVVCPGTVTPWGSWTDPDEPGWGTFAMVPEKVWEQLCTPLPAPENTSPVTAETVENVPTSLSEKLGDLDAAPVGKRSQRFHHLVAECRRAGLTQGQAVTLLTPWCAAVNKYVGRVETNVAASWAKVAAVELTKGKLRTIPMGRQLARERLAGAYLYVTDMGWHHWDGLRWCAQSDDHMLAVAANWAENFIVDLIRKGADDGVVKEALKYRDVGMVRQLLAGARTEVSIVKNAADMDNNPGVLPCANGVVDLTTGTITTLTADLLNTKNTGIDYIPGATHPDWDAALSAIPDVDSRRWVQLCIGAAATGQPDRGGPVVFHQGEGLNGKTTVLGAVVTGFGDYATLLPDKLLTGHGNEHDTLWMPLRGARLAYLEELPEDHTLPVAKIKKLVDTPELTGRLIGKDYVTWTATHSLMISTNYWPRVSETDHGTWRRLAMVTYPIRFAGDKQDVTLKRRVKTGTAQRQAVLAWIVEGAVRWYAEGQTLADITAKVKESTDEWQDMGDALGAFLRHHLQATGDDSHRIATNELLSRFNDTLPMGNKAWSPSLFGTRLRSHSWVTEQGLSVNRGARNREPMGLSGVAWNESAQGAQGHVRDSQQKPFRETTDSTLRTLRAPTNRDTETGPCIKCTRPTNRYGEGGGPLCKQCREQTEKEKTA